VLHNPLAQQASADHHRSNINHSDVDNINKHPSASLDQYTDPTHPNRTAGIFGRMRMKSAGHAADITNYYQRGSPPASGITKPFKEEQADDTTGTGADDNASAASSKMSTLSNVSERRIQWNPLPAGPTVGAMDAALHNNAPMEDSHFQFTSVPLEIFFPVRSRGSSNNVPEWLKISSRSLDHPPRRNNDEWLDDSEDDEGASEHHHQAEHTPVPPSAPPPPPESPPSPLQQLLLPRLAPLVTTEPSPSIPRPTLGKHSQSAPVADLYTGQRRQFPPVTPTSASNLARPQSLHHFTNPRRRPRSMATGPRDGSLSFRSAYSSCAMSMASSTANASQLSDADMKLLGGRGRYRNSSARFQKSSSSSVLTLSVGSLVGQSSWVTAPGMTVATSSGSFEPASGGGSPRSRRTALTSAADDDDDDKVRDGLVAVSLQEGSDEDADGINCGPAEHRRRVSVLRFSGGGGGGAVVVSRWMDRGVAWMSGTTRHVRRRRPKLPSPIVRVATKGGSDAAAPTSHPDLQRSSGCLT
jgi:hypothetical protein